MDNHFISASNAVESGRQSIALMSEAKKILAEARARENVRVWVMKL